MGSGLELTLIASRTYHEDSLKRVAHDLFCKQHLLRILTSRLSKYIEWLKSLLIHEGFSKLVSSLSLERHLEMGGAETGD